MDDLVDFLLERLADDEEYARTMLDVGQRRAAAMTPDNFADMGGLAIDILTDQKVGPVLAKWGDGHVLPPNDLNRAMAEIDTKRLNIDLHSAKPGQHPDFCWHDKHELPCPTLRLLALPYADHAGYNPAWKPV